MKFFLRSKNLIYRCFILIFIIFIPFLSIQAQSYFCNLEDSIISDIWIGQQTIDSGLAHSGYFVSVTDAVNPYGFGMEMNFPEEKQGVNTIVTIDGWVKASVAIPNAKFVISINEQGDELFWRAIQLDTIVKNAHTWYNFNGMVKVPASVTKEAVFKCYLWNTSKKEVVAIDDLRVQFTHAENPSFLPLFDQIEMGLKDEVRLDEILFSNPFYKIVLDKETNTIAFLSNGYKPIAGHFLSFEQMVIGKEEIKQSKAFLFKAMRSSKGITKLRLKVKNKTASTTLVIQCDAYSPQLKFVVDEKYRKRIECKRSAILFKSEQPIREVMRANRKSETNNFQQEYWLDKQGALFGEDNNTLYIYHAPGISSLQLDAEKNMLCINLDYEKDHPFLHFPLRNDTIDFKEDWSAAKFKKGSKRTNSFKIYIGVPADSPPRMMKNPIGFLATYIWTEHADFSNIQTNRATYFGSEEITSPDKASGGFVFYNIPVTKSVFYDNPDQITNAEISGGRFTGLESAIKTDTAFHRFLKQIAVKEIEICLHTPEQFTTTPEQLEAALNFTKIHFNSKSWIDHGYNNLIHNNREDFMCDGLLKKSPFYATEQWKKNGVKYFWNAYYEDYFTFSQWRFSSSIEPYFIGFGDFMPKPDYWLHPTRSGGFIHWPTSTVLYVENEALWAYFFNDRNLISFVENWSVEMNHCYPAWVDPKKGFWTYNADSTTVAQPGFNQTLEKMSNLKNEGLLNVTTVKEFLDYQLLMENVDYQIIPDGRVRVINNNTSDIPGLSFATKAKVVLVDGLKPSQKISGEDLIFWFDLPKGGTRIIRVID